MSKILVGDVRDILPTLESESVQMCVTSPPYWSLRDYGVDGQLGIEKTPEEYVENMVAVFREVRRVLKADGTAWVNMGDGYTSGGTKSRDPGQSKLHPAFDGKESAVTAWRPDDPPGLKPKDLIGMPWRLAFALQAEGWYLRQDIVWSKPNPMPESVTDRCTKAHEYLFLLSKSPRYYFDAESIKERGQDWGPRNRKMNSVGLRPEKTGQPAHSFHEGKSDCAYAESGRNKRSVWTVASKPYSGAHFATFPEKLIEPCILAGSRPGDVVLDPFFGSGTTGQVCERLGRDWVGIDLNSEYAEMAKRRTAQMGLVI